MKRTLSQKNKAKVKRVEIIKFMVSGTATLE